MVGDGPRRHERRRRRVAQIEAVVDPDETRPAEHQPHARQAKGVAQQLAGAADDLLRFEVCPAARRGVAECVKAQVC
jgi:hypothetical protein